MSSREGGAERVRKAIDEAEKVTPEAPRPLMRELPPADPFPVESLGDVLAPAAIAIHDRVRAPPAICGQSVLACATLTVQAHADVELPTYQLRPLTNFYMSIAATGERKTSVDAEALWPVRKREVGYVTVAKPSSAIIRTRNLHGRRRALPKAGSSLAGMACRMRQNFAPQQDYPQHGMASLLSGSAAEKG
jgi:hypothetical protein